MAPSVSERLNALRKILESGKNSTQEELRDMLEAKGHNVNQSTISRDLRKIGAIKGTDNKGRTVYRLSDISQESTFVAQSVGDLILNITHNDSMIVIQTSPGSASLVARHLDMNKPADILGTIAGDDTIFVAPSKDFSIKQTINAIRDSFQS
jgi:transcriptional regulator of arginine metabolism